MPRRVLENFPYHYHHLIIYEVIQSPIIRSSPDQDDGTFKKADWKRFSLQFDKFVRWISVTAEYYDRFVGYVISTAKKYIPIGYKNEFEELYDDCTDDVDSVIANDLLQALTDAWKDQCIKLQRN